MEGLAKRAGGFALVFYDIKFLFYTPNKEFINMTLSTATSIDFSNNKWAYEVVLHLVCTKRANPLPPPPELGVRLCPLPPRNHLHHRGCTINFFLFLFVLKTPSYP